MKLDFIAFYCCFVFFPSIVNAQQDYSESSGWETEDIVPFYFKMNSEHNYIVCPTVLIASKLIHFYQQKIASQSISRCPFYISCSNYTYNSIKKYGLIIGICYFIDRNLYRENSGSYLYYSLRENEAGILKLDDSFYLFGEKTIYTSIENEKE